MEVTCLLYDSIKSRGSFFCRPCTCHSKDESNWRRCIICYICPQSSTTPPANFVKKFAEFSPKNITASEMATDKNQKAEFRRRQTDNASKVYVNSYHIGSVVEQNVQDVIHGERASVDLSLNEIDDQDACALADAETNQSLCSLNL
ncbi:hypothetical protein P9112_010122 [Eukaryota sp. TZLM1-RC]